jgi:hypothetical protein
MGKAAAIRQNVIVFVPIGSPPCLIKIKLLSLEKALRTAIGMFGAPWICRRCINTYLKPGRRRLWRFASTSKCLYLPKQAHVTNSTQQAMPPFRQRCSHERAVWPRSTKD